MIQERLCNLSIMCIEGEILKGIDFEDIIEDFAEKKSRKKSYLNDFKSELFFF